MTITEMMDKLKAGDFDGRLREIYVDEAVLPYQRERYRNALSSYQELFGGGEAVVFSAPGRSEVGGNHTDHQRGMVLAASVNLDAIAVASPLAENRIRLKSEGYPMLEVELSELEKKESEEGTSQALIRGMVQGLREQGNRIGGFQAYVTSDVLGAPAFLPRRPLRCWWGRFFRAFTTRRPFPWWRSPRRPSMRKMYILASPAA